MYNKSRYKNQEFSSSFTFAGADTINTHVSKRPPNREAAETTDQLFPVRPVRKDCKIEIFARFVEQSKLETGMLDARAGAELLLLVGRSRKPPT